MFVRTGLLSQTHRNFPFAPWHQLQQLSPNRDRIMNNTSVAAYRTPKQYHPEEAKDKLSLGSTASVWKHSELPGVVIKAPTNEPWPPEAENKFYTEAAILQALGPHPRIVKYGLNTQTLSVWNLR